jgi:energy-coupling factor transporter ATP-binding protein EcfA2
MNMANPLAYKRDERFQHSYVIGATGSGKSTLLLNLITQDIHHGYGIIVLSPEQDLFDRLLAYIPDSRKNDLIYVDPHDIKPPVIGFNPFILEEDEELETKAGETMTVLERALGDLGVSMRPLMTYAVYALLQLPQSTISDLEHLLDPKDPTLRRIIAKTDTVDTRTRKFWAEYDRESYYHRSIGAVVNRLDIFFRDPMHTILSTPALSFKKEMNSAQRIIFLNVSELRDRQQECTGQLLLAQIQQVILSRNHIPERQRIPYYLYIDEFQMFAEHSGDSLRNLFNGARKFRLAVTVAHQTTADLPARLLRIITDNAGTIICKRLAGDDASFFAKQLQIRRQDTTAYAPEVLQNLTRAQAYVSTPSRQIGVHTTVPKNPIVRMPVHPPKHVLIALSKRNYGLIPDIKEDEDVDEFPAPDPQPPETPAPHTEKLKAKDPAPPRPTPPRAETQEPKDLETPAPNPKPQSTSRKKRKRFDEDAGEPEIEIL